MYRCITVFEINVFSAPPYLFSFLPGCVRFESWWRYPIPFVSKMSVAHCDLTIWKKSGFGNHVYRLVSHIGKHIGEVFFMVFEIHCILLLLNHCFCELMMVFCFIPKNWVNVGQIWKQIMIFPMLQIPGLLGAISHFFNNVPMLNFVYPKKLYEGWCL